MTVNDASSTMSFMVPLVPKRFEISKEQGRALYWIFLVLVVLLDLYMQYIMNQYRNYIAIRYDGRYRDFPLAESFLSSVFLVGLFIHISKFAVSLLYRECKEDLDSHILSLLLLLIWIYLVVIFSFLLYYAKDGVGNFVSLIGYYETGSILRYAWGFVALISITFLSYYQALKSGVNFNNFFLKYLATTSVISVIEGLMWVLYTLALLSLGG